MPRRTDDDEDMPRRRRRSAKAAAIEAEEERGLVMRIFLHSPKDVVAGLIAATAICAILTNALFLQAGRHPSPMFGGSKREKEQTWELPLAGRAIPSLVGQGQRVFSIKSPRLRL